MDNAAAITAEQLAGQISQQVHHAIEHAVDSPLLVNRVVGESMRHIGACLEFNSVAYLPLRQEEVLTQPEKLAADSRDAVVLIKRQIVRDNAFLLMVTCKKVEDSRFFDIVAYRPDTFSLDQTKFVQLPENVGRELTRQLNVLIQGEGSALLQAILLKDYFPIEEVQPANDALPTVTAQLATPTAPVAAETPATPVTPATGGLPPVADSALL